MRRVRDLLEGQGRLDAVVCEWDVDSGAASESVFEPHRLEQVLVNLLLNALHALRTVEGPVLTVRLARAEGELLRMPPRREADHPGINYLHRRRVDHDEARFDSVANAERLLVIEVSDNGPGIPSGMVEHIFDPFFTTKEPGEGTGLGLSICARLVEGMGGRIDALVASGGGARFVIMLPGAYDRDSTTGTLEKT